MKLADAIRSFPEQFVLPVQENGDISSSKILVAGMGGSHLAADLLKAWHPELDIVVHRDYGLPELPDLTERLLITVSYSGNTEETLSALKEAQAKGMKVAVIASGGTLLSEAQEGGLPYIRIPTHIQPRFALGYLFMALVSFVDKNLLSEAEALAGFDAAALEETGREIADVLKGSIPLIYTSTRNNALGYIWKIEMNENAKIPAFQNAFPELNHNEMEGTLRTEGMSPSAGALRFVFLRDSEDSPRIQTRMNVLTELLTERGASVYTLELSGDTRLSRLLYGLILAQWSSCVLADQEGIDPEPVDIVEEFKKRIADSSL